MQRVLDDVHEQFIKAVAEGRKMLPDDVRSSLTEGYFQQAGPRCRLIDERNRMIKL